MKSATGSACAQGKKRRVLGLSTVNVQRRAECDHVTNTTRFANPNAALGAPGFGSITSIGNSIPRQMPFAANVLF